MKITLDKTVITLEKAKEAKEFAKAEGEWIDAGVLKDCASRILAKWYDRPALYIEEMVNPGYLEVTIDHYEMCVYANDVTVRYYHGGEHFACLGFNVQDCVADKIHAFVRIFDRTACTTV